MTDVKFYLLTDEVQELSISDQDEDDVLPPPPSIQSRTLKSDDIIYVELEKGDRGLGFSILDYQVHIPFSNHKSRHPPIPGHSSMIELEFLTNGGLGLIEGSRRGGGIMWSFLHCFDIAHDSAFTGHTARFALDAINMKLCNHWSEMVRRKLHHLRITFKLPRNPSIVPGLKESSMVEAA